MGSESKRQESVILKQTMSMDENASFQKTVKKSFQGRSSLMIVQSEKTFDNIVDNA